MFNSNRLKKLRKELGLSQLEMSERLQIQQSSYSKYETNKADLNLALLEKLQEEFGIAPGEFIIANNKFIHFENGMKVGGNAIAEPTKYYSVPKEIIDSILASQQNIEQLISTMIKMK